eukprot:1241007-Rhodomonas_salina.3
MTKKTRKLKSATKMTSSGSAVQLSCFAPPPPPLRGSDPSIMSKSVSNVWASVENSLIFIPKLTQASAPKPRKSTRKSSTKCLGEGRREEEGQSRAERRRERRHERGGPNAEVGGGWR